MSDHTNGPWKFESEYDHNAEPVFTVRGPNGCLIADCNTIISTGEHIGCGTAFPEANARLIASAPELSAKAALVDELVAALKELKRFCCRPGDDDKGDDGYDRAQEMCRVVLAKVREKGG